MAERAKFFDDIAGMAGGAFSALTGVGEELTALVRTRVDEALSRLSLVRREEFEVVSELAAQARAGQELAESRLSALEARIAALEAPQAAAAPAPPPPELPLAGHDPHTAPDGPPGADPSALPPAPH